MHRKVKTSEQRAVWLLDKGMRVLARWLDNTGYGKKFTKEELPAPVEGGYVYPVWGGVETHPKWREEHTEVYSVRKWVSGGKWLHFYPQGQSYQRWMTSAQALPGGREREELLEGEDEGDLLGINLEARLEGRAMVQMEERIAAEIEAQIAARGGQ